MSQLDCGQVEPKLSAWIDGQLDDAQAEQVRDHLVQCPGCWGELQALEIVSNRLAALKAAPVAAPPAGLTAAVRALPTWLVLLAVARHWLAAGGGLALVGVACVAILQWSTPLPAMLSVRQRQETRMLTPGTTVWAKPGEPVTITLTPGDGTLQLHGPGALVIRQAQVGRVQHDQRLAVELTAGALAVRFGPRAMSHALTVTTPQAMIRVTGTWVMIQATPVATQVVVMDGAALVQNRATGRTLHAIPGQVVAVQAGWMTVRQVPTDEWLAQKGVAASGSEPGSGDLHPTPHRTPLTFDGQS